MNHKINRKVSAIKDTRDTIYQIIPSAAKLGCTNHGLCCVVCCYNRTGCVLTIFKTNYSKSETSNQRQQQLFVTVHLGDIFPQRCNLLQLQLLLLLQLYSRLVSTVKQQKAKVSLVVALE